MRYLLGAVALALFALLLLAMVTAVPRSNPAVHQRRPRTRTQMSGQQAQLTAPGREAVGPADRPQPPLDPRSLGVGDRQQQVVAAAQHRRRFRCEEDAVTQDQRDRRVPGQPEFGDLDPAQQLTPWGCRRRACWPRCPRTGACSISSSAVISGSTTASRDAAQGRVGPRMTVKTTTSRKVTSKICCAFGTPAVMGKVASTMGTAPRNPAHEVNACSRHGIRNGMEHSATDRARHEGQGDPDDERWHQRIGQPAR